MDQQIQTLLESLKDPLILDNPNQLSRLIIELSALNYQVGIAAAQAQLRENQEAVQLLDIIPEPGEKKTSVAEAEKRSIWLTNNEYTKYKNQSAAIIEIVQSIKKRLDVLSFEHRGS